MKEQIKKLDFSLLEIDPVMEYLNQFQDYEVIKEEIEKENGQITIIWNEELIKIVFLDIKYAKWWSIYRYHKDGIKYEQMDCILYKKIKEKGYNRIIKYAGHREDGCYSYIVCSCFCYLDEEFVSSWKKTRVVPMEELKKIQYSDSMNLTELIYMTDKKSNTILKKEDLRDVPLTLKLEKKEDNV